MPAVRFDGNDRLTGVLDQNFSNATVFIVARYAGATSTNSYIYTVGDQSGGGSHMTLSRYSGMDSYHYNGSSQFFGDPIPGQAWHVFSQVYRCAPDGTNWHALYVDGVDRHVEVAPAPYAASGSLVLGDWVADGDHFNGDLFELRIYDRAMSDPERQAIEGELLALLGPQPDVNASGAIDVTDLLGIISGWGICNDCPPFCPGDV